MGKSISTRLDALENRVSPTAFVRCTSCDSIVSTRDGEDDPLKCNGCGAAWPNQPDDTSIVVEYFTFDIGQLHHSEDSR